MPDPYASHLPVLKMVTALIEPARVLEFGSGDHSTPFFLSLPIDELVSVEQYETYRQKLEREFTDPRLTLTATKNGHDLKSFDLVFIDDGWAAADREETIRMVLGQEHPPVVIHDAEVHEYARAIGELAGLRCLHIPTDPQTAVCW